MPQKIYLVGAGITGWEGFGPKAQEVIAKADLLIGHQRHLDIFPDFAGEKQELGDLSIMLELLKNSDKRTVILGSGDPNFFGIARFLLRNLPKERIEIFPNVTSVQYAFARIKEPWDDAVFVSVHGRGMGRAVDRIVAAEKVAILTDGVNTPAAIARDLIARGAEGYDAWLCEDLGMPGEKFTKTDVRGLLDLKHSELNILILIKTWEPNLIHYPLIGIEDEEFATSKKLITKQEVRAVTLAKLRIQDDLVMWDIGAGSGSVSIEASNLMPNGKVYALERNAQCLGFLRDNLKKFVARNVMLVEAFAPEGLEELPEPDRVFIGGSGGMLEEIIEAVDRRLKSEGVIVLNAVTLDTLTKSVEFLEDHGYTVEVTCVNISRTRGLTEYKMFEAHNPVYIVAAWKESE
ncbi:precorrin-6y C5,15-methyltransferase (decarboxylating) subunit CbiE [Geobacter pelophilus]|uniref:Precorrin-6y C5,15-methyltransferase (Decarboxylating) subunit CbiE n=1 Tax=Geoanaerobacter pelophilus TaxID=60036 RepID=A0AAW4KZ27_9BACT|nr:precorrin-6y C5,15-methyltransferase (decarboxylating) subunit CbiE [Geoanaerobacter pelophilus]MBT0663901.1 precorrin-6y C5,15-methyltransferase (decarboxylating) subunit CbiE [Geoanaerobacter pelophilus]